MKSFILFILTITLPTVSYSYDIVSKDIKDNGYYNILCDNGRSETVWINTNNNGYYYSNSNGYTSSSMNKVAKEICNVKSSRSFLNNNQASNYAKKRSAYDSMLKSRTKINDLSLVSDSYIGKKINRTPFKKFNFLDRGNNGKSLSANLGGRPLYVYAKNNNIIDIQLQPIGSEDSSKFIEYFSKKYSKFSNIKKIEALGVTIYQRTWVINKSKKCGGKDLKIQVTENLNSETKEITGGVRIECDIYG